MFKTFNSLTCVSLYSSVLTTKLTASENEVKLLQTRLSASEGLIEQHQNRLGEDNKGNLNRRCCSVNAGNRGQSWKTIHYGVELGEQMLFCCICWCILNVTAGASYCVYDTSGLMLMLCLQLSMLRCPA